MMTSKSILHRYPRSIQLRSNIARIMERLELRHMMTGDFC